MQLSLEFVVLVNGTANVFASYGPGYTVPFATTSFNGAGFKTIQVTATDANGAGTVVTFSFEVESESPWFSAR